MSFKSELFRGLFFAIRKCGIRLKLFGFFSDCDAFIPYYAIFVAVAISKVKHPLFGVGRLSTVSEDEPLAVVTVNILISESITEFLTVEIQFK